jgi:hypothetical protein
VVAGRAEELALTAWHFLPRHEQEQSWHVRGLIAQLSWATTSLMVLTALGTKESWLLPVVNMDPKMFLSSVPLEAAVSLKSFPCLRTY